MDVRMDWKDGSSRGPAPAPIKWALRMIYQNSLHLCTYTIGIYQLQQAKSVSSCVGPHTFSLSCAESAEQRAIYGFPRYDVSSLQVS